MKLTFVVPCYNEEKNISLFYEDICRNFNNKKYKLELIFINDGSKDGTLNELKKLISNKDYEIKIIDFSRNFGKEAGIYAGLIESTGDYVALIDADMQQPPHLVLNMLKEVEKNESIDIVTYYQEKRIEGKVLTFFKSKFYKIINRITGLPFVNGASDFRLVRRNVVNEILKLSEHDRFSKGIFAWIGFNTYYLPYVPEKRANGNTNWNFKSLFKYAIMGIMSFTNEPLKFIFKLGIIDINISILWLLLNMFILHSNYQYIFIFIFFMFGINFIILGIISEYIFRNYNESRNRPIYITREVIVNDKNN